MNKADRYKVTWVNRETFLVTHRYFRNKIKMIRFVLTLTRTGRYVQWEDAEGFLLEVPKNLTSTKDWKQK
jgi:hypothetical protein